MPKVINRNYSTFYDATTSTQFDRLLDRQTGCYIAVADVAPKAAKAFGDRPGFEVLSADEFTAMTTTPEPEDPDEPETGDPVKDQAAANGGQGAEAMGPPAPPASS